jgi:copper chaperone CopZ
MMIRWRDLLVAPTALLHRVDDHTARVEVSGMLCDGACVRRVERSLLALPGVVKVEHKAGSSAFGVEGAIAGLSESQIDEAVQRMVVLRPLRQALGWLGLRLARGPRSDDATV